MAVTSLSEASRTSTPSARRRSWPTRQRSRCRAARGGPTRRRTYGGLPRRRRFGGVGKLLPEAVDVLPCPMRWEVDVQRLSGTVTLWSSDAKTRRAGHLGDLVRVQVCVNVRGLPPHFAGHLPSRALGQSQQRLSLLV